MKESRFWLLFLVVVIVQLVIGNFLYFSPYVLINLLPGLMLCIPLKRPLAAVMVVAFLVGFVVDFLGDGLLGITGAPLVLSALFSRRILSLCNGADVFADKRDCPPLHMGKGNFFVANILSAALFFTLYVLLDGAGMRPVLFNLVRICVSTLSSAILSQLTTRYLFGTR